MTGIVVALVGLVGIAEDAKAQLFSSGFTNAADWVSATTSDTRATFNYDYSLDAIPAAPNGSDRVGLKLEANLSSGALHEIAVMPANFSAPNSDYRVKVDIWGNWAVGSQFSTEFSGLFIGHNGTTAGRNGTGLLYTADGGAARDYRVYKNAGEQFVASGQYNPDITANCDPLLPDNGDCRNGGATYFFDNIPGFDVGLALDPDDGQGIGQVGVQNNGNGGFQWMTMQIDVFPNRLGPAGTTTNLGVAEITLFVHGDPANPFVPARELFIARVDNSNGGTVVNMLGKPAVVYADLFTSIADFPQYQFGIFDNFVVSSLVTTPDADFNNDGLFNCTDVNALTAEIAAGTNMAAFDLTGDGSVNIADLDKWRLDAGSVNIGAGRAYKVGDANLDGNVDGTDFGLWNANKFTSNTAWCNGNFNADSVTDGSDFGLWNSNKFTSSDGSLVPEPAGLTAFGLLLLVACRRK